MAEQGDSLADVLRQINEQDQTNASLRYLAVTFSEFYRTARETLGNRTDAYVAGMFRASRPE